MPKYVITLHSIYSIDCGIIRIILVCGVLRCLRTMPTSESLCQVKELIIPGISAFPECLHLERWHLMGKEMERMQNYTTVVRRRPQNSGWIQEVFLGNRVKHMK